MNIRSVQRRTGKHRQHRSTLRNVVACGVVISSASLTVVAPGADAAVGGGTCAPNNRFGRLIPSLPAATFNDTNLSNVARFITETNHVENVNGRTDIDFSQDESDIDAGYTYVGQFIDHDIVLDPRESVTGIVDPATLINSRTPQLDLDSVYGAGPTGSPALYNSDRMTLKLGAAQTGSASDPNPRDVLRDSTGRAVLGDPRNDENRIVGSFHSIMTRFHNKVALDLKTKNPSMSNAQVFEAARKEVRWTYQWAILTDFLPTMSSDAAVARTARYDGNRWQTTLNWYDSCRGSMPTEFSVAAYRWHTMVRNDYVVNDAVRDLPIFNGSFNPRANLSGFQPAPSDFGFDWDFYFQGGARSVQQAYKFDNSLVPALGILPAAAAGTVNLSERNLLRGKQMQLPSGQSVARALGLPVLSDDKVIIGPALGVGADTRALVQFSPEFANNAPLWAYVAAESVNQAFSVAGGRIVAGDTHSLRLGPVSTVIVNETLAGLMANDPDSVVNHPEFKPSSSLLSGGRVKFRDIIRYAQRPSLISSSYEVAPWGARFASDGLGLSTTWSMGWSSNSSTTSNHVEWYGIDNGSSKSMSMVALVPRTDMGNIGTGFPVDFRIETSDDGVNWTVRNSQVGYAKPLFGIAQSFNLGGFVSARFVRVVGTNLRADTNDPSNPYRMQLAELYVL